MSHPVVPLVAFVILPLLADGPFPPARNVDGRAAGAFLRPGVGANETCPPGGVRIYELRQPSGEYVRLWVEAHHELDISIARDDTILLAMKLPSRAIVPISWIAERSGSYNVRVRCTDNRAGQSYGLTVEMQHMSTARDRQRLPDERAFVEAEALAGRWEQTHRRRALQQFEIIATKLSDSGGARLAQRARIRLGDLKRSFGISGEALQEYRRALPLRNVSSDPNVEIDALLGLAVTHLRLGELERGMRFVDHAFALCSKTRDGTRLARTLTTRGRLYHEQRNFELAMSDFRTSIELSRRIGSTFTEAQGLLHRGFVLSDRGDERRARIDYEKALSRARQDEDARTEALVLMALGHVSSKTGEIQDALLAYTRAEALFEQIGDPYWDVGLYSGLGFVYEELGHYELARKYYDRVLELEARVPSPFGRATSLLQLGRVLAALEEWDKSIEYLQRSLPIYETLEERRMEAIVLGLLANTYGSLQRIPESLRYYDKALSLHRQSGFKRFEVDTLNDLGDLRLRLGETTAASLLFARALSLSRETNYPFGETMAVLGLAKSKRVSGDLPTALESTRQALETAELLISDLSSYTLRSMYSASIRELYELQVTILMDLHDRLPRAGYDVEAFRAAETARSRSLLEMLTQSSKDEHQRSSARLRARRNELEADIRARAATRFREREGAEHVFDLAEPLAKLDRLDSLVRLRNQGATLLEPRTVGITEVQRVLLDSNTLLLAYFLAEEGSYLWAISERSVAVYRLKPRAQIETDARQLQELLVGWQQQPGETARQHRLRMGDAATHIRELTASLGRSLLEPVSDVLREKLIIVGDGALHQLPFSMLRMPARRGGDSAFLVENHEVSRLPSASAWSALRQRQTAIPPPSQEIAVFADPVFDPSDPRVGPDVAGTDRRQPHAPSSAATTNGLALARALDHAALLRDDGIPRLLASRQEAASILDFFPEGERLQAMSFDATRELALSDKLRDYRILHFATHGIIDYAHPELSGLVLTLVDRNGEPLDGFMRLRDIYRLQLSADLVVLSACSSALGTQVPGEIPIGLIRGFLAAGAAGVVASYWAIDDEATAELMKRFYNHMLRHHLSPSGALREAQAELRRTERWSEPFHWAAFEFHGAEER